MSGQPNDNPYAAPQVTDTTELPQAEAVPEALPLFPQRPERWGPVFVFNLPAVIVLGVYVNQPRSFMAMIAACVVLFLVSLSFARRSALIARRLIAGGKVVALSQFIPLLHIGLGMLAFHLLFRVDPRGILGWPVRGSFYFTLLVGTGLILVAYVLGISLARPRTSFLHELESRTDTPDSDSSHFPPNRS